MNVGDATERVFERHFQDLDRIKVSISMDFCYGPDTFGWAGRSVLTTDRPHVVLGVYDEVTETFVCTNTARECVFLKSIGEIIFKEPLRRIRDPLPVIINYAKGLGTQASKMVVYFIIVQQKKYSQKSGK
jgi:hypothetical protein